MDREEVKKTFYSILNSDGYRPEEIDEKYSFTDDLGMDSLEVVELTIDIEKEFNIVISDETMEMMQHSTIGEVIDMIQEMTN